MDTEPADSAPRVCVGAVLVRGGRVLLGRRAAWRAWLPGVWDVVGGHREPGETLEQTLAREVREELGVPPLAWHAVATAHDAGVTLHLFAVTDWDGHPTNAQPAEHDAIAWLTPDEASALPLAHPAYGALVREVVRMASCSSRDGPTRSA